MALKPSDRSEFEMMKHYIVEVTKQFEFAQTIARFGGIYSSDLPTSVIGLGSINDINSLNLAIQNIEYIPATGSVSTTFDVAVEHFKSYGRHGIPKIYIQLLSLSADVEATNLILNAALDLDIQIFTVKFGEHVATEVVTIFDASDLSSFGELSKGICNGKLKIIILLSNVCAFLVPSCQNPPMDIIFALDASDTLERTESTVHNFVVDVGLNYKISEENTRIGVIHYTSIAEVVIPLGHFIQLHKLSERIFDAHYTGGVADQALAIVTAQQEFISTGRSEAKHVLILITNSTVNDFAETHRAAELAKEMKIEIFLLHIGESAEELNIVSDPKAEHFLMIKSPSVGAFSLIIPELTQNICSHEGKCFDVECGFIYFP